jgi:hypothetical protein
MLLALAASFTANLPGEPQSPASGGAGRALQDQAKPSAKASPSASARKIPCKTPENAALCYWTHGRLSVANGNPSFRIWRIGTHRILGVFNGPSHFPPRTIADDESPEFPPELDRAYEADNRAHKRATGFMWAVPPPVFANFEVCPLDPERKGWMQPVCVESARNIFIENDY